MMCCPCMVFDMWKGDEENSITKEHAIKLMRYYKAMVLGYSKAEKKVKIFDEKEFSKLEPVLSPISEEISDLEERIKGIIQLLIEHSL